jgi:hypothetical protein
MGFIRGIAYLDLFAYELCRTLIEDACDRYRGVILYHSGEGDLEGPVEFLFGRPSHGGCPQGVHHSVHGGLVDAVMHLTVVVMGEPSQKQVVEVIDPLECSGIDQGQELLPDASEKAFDLAA